MMTVRQSIRTSTDPEWMRRQLGAGPWPSKLQALGALAGGVVIFFVVFFGAASI